MLCWNYGRGGKQMYLCLSFCEFYKVTIKLKIGYKYAFLNF